MAEKGELPEVLGVRLPGGTLSRLKAVLGENESHASFCRQLILSAIEQREVEARRALKVANVANMIAPLHPSSRQDFGVR